MYLHGITLHPENYPVNDCYPFNLRIFHETKKIEFRTPVTCFVGENGTGKSTLLEAITQRCGIHIWRAAEKRRFKYNPYEKKLGDYISLERSMEDIPGSFFGSSIFQDFILILDEWASADPGQLQYFGGKSLVSQSHGQSIMSYFGDRYKRNGLYMLDEPETALSPSTQIKLLGLISRMSAAGHAQFIIATHSPILLACPGAVIYSFDCTPVKEVVYKETEHYRVYRDFLDNI
ncbi:MAG: AAA family ATPase [Spirochaetes bacterium]|nr:AAA family ATPase [Spirochaetota bacterium]